ncbi:MAG: serine/threonine-protein kinase [Polyangiales bacterium]
MASRDDDVDAPDAPVMNSRAFDRTPDAPAGDGSDAMAGWDDDWQRGDVLGDYELTSKLGEGGMSRVYEARHRALGTRVAIKTLRPDHREKPVMCARFEREAQATARVQHPNVVKVITVGTHRGSPYLVMEFLTGRDLEKRIDEGGPMAVADALALLLPVFAAVQEAHDQGLVHRDLKPANIVLEQWRDGRVRPVVVDFGIAGLVETPTVHRLTHGLLGTPAYMAPEQTRGERKLDASLDQYALGAIVYECLAGVPAFQGASVYEVMARVSAGSFAPLETVRAGVPEGVARAVARAMSAEAGQRFPSVRSFARALLPFADELTRAQWAPVFAGDDASEGGTTVPDAVLPMPEPRPEEAPSPTPSRHGTTLGDAAGSFDASTPPRPAPRRSRGTIAFVATCGVLGVAAFTTMLLHGRATAAPPRFAVALTAEPATARVSVDGAPATVGVLRATYAADGTSHRVRVEADGCAAEEFLFVNAPPPERVQLRCTAAPVVTPTVAAGTPVPTAAPTPTPRVVAAPQPVTTGRRGRPTRGRNGRIELPALPPPTGRDCIGPNGTNLCL